jgi:hypothetical protein
MDLPESGVAPDDVEGVRRLTAEVMERLTELVLELRSRYPARWSD